MVLSDTLKTAMKFGAVGGEVMPSFPGGDTALLQFLTDNAIFPKELEETCISGRVVASFYVEADGSITEPEIVRSLDPLLDKEALRVISLMPKWKPGEINGKPARVKYHIPIRFRLANANDSIH